MKTDSQFHLEPANEFFDYEKDDNYFDSAYKTLGQGLFLPPMNAVGMANDFVRGDIMGDPYYQRDWSESPLENAFNISSVIPGLGMLPKLAKAPKTFLPAARQGAGLKGLGQGKVAGAATVAGAGEIGQNLNAEYHEPGSIGAFFEPEKVRPVEDPAQAQAQAQAQPQPQGVNDFNEPMTPQQMAIAENAKRFQQMAGIAGDDDPLIREKMNIVQLEALDRETPGGLNFTDKTRLIDARRAVRDAEKEENRLAYEERRKNRTSSPMYIPPRASRPASQEVMVFPKDGSGPVTQPNMEAARQYTKDMGFTDNSISQAKAEQLANKFDIPVKSFDRNIAYDLNVHGLTPETARQQRGINPVTGELSDREQALFDEREAEKKRAFDLQEKKKMKDYTNFGLQEDYNQRMQEKIKREHPFLTNQQLLKKRFEQQSGF